MNYVQNLQQQYDTHKKDIEKLAVILPQKKRGDTIIFGIQTIATQSGIQLKRISLSPSSGLDEYGSQLVSIDLSGSYQNLINFITTIEKNIRILDIRSMEIGEASSGPAGSLNIGMTLATYNLK